MLTYYFYAGIYNVMDEIQILCNGKGKPDISSAALTDD
jgi:hypothetical protein